MSSLDNAVLKAVVPILFGTVPSKDSGIGIGYGFGSGIGSGYGIGDDSGSGPGGDYEESLDITTTGDTK